MPTAFRFGTRSATRRNWQECDRPRFRPGPRSRPRRHPFTELEAALRALIRFHQSHPDWFPPAAAVPDAGLPPPLPPEWEAALNKVYGPDLGGTGGSSVASGVPPEASIPAPKT